MPYVLAHCTIPEESSFLIRISSSPAPKESVELETTHPPSDVADIPNPLSSFVPPYAFAQVEGAEEVMGCRWMTVTP